MNVQTDTYMHLISSRNYLYMLLPHLYIYRSTKIDTKTLFIIKYCVAQQVFRASIIHQKFISKDLEKVKIKKVLANFVFKKLFILKWKLQCKIR